MWEKSRHYVSELFIYFYIVISVRMFQKKSPNMRLKIIIYAVTFSFINICLI